MKPKTTSQENHIILIADDDPPTVRVFADAFQEAGFQVLEAMDGEQALSIALEKRPDLILLDIQMPKMDGLIMLRELRKDNWGKSAKVVLISNFSEDERIATAISLGAFHYLLKGDWKISDLVKKINEIIETK